MYTITVQSWTQGSPTELVYTAPEYEVRDGVLTVAIDEDHDIVIPLFQVQSVDIRRNN